MFKHKFNADKNEVLVTLKWERSDFETKLQKSLDLAVKNIKVPGYRPGKAPKEKLLQRVDILAVQDRLIKDYVNSKWNDLTKYLDDKKLKVLNYILNLSQEDNKDDEYINLDVHLPVIPSFDDVDFSKVDVKLTLPKVTKENVKDDINHFTSHLTTKTEVKEKTAKTQLRDTVVLDFKGFIDDVAFEGGEATHYELELGSNSFIAGFEDQLLDKKTGYEGEVNVTFPTTYFVKEYAGKEAIFKVKIHKILRQSTLALDDSVFEKLGHKNVKNLKDFEKLTELKLNLEGLSSALTKYVEELAFEAYKQSKTKLNKIFFEKEITKLKNEFNKNLEQFGIKKREYISLLKTSEKAIDDEINASAEKTAAISFLRSKMIENLKFDQKAAKEQFKDKLAYYSQESEAENISEFLVHNIELLKLIGKAKESKDIENFIAKKITK